MNEEKHWNKLAGRYEDEIFDVFASDKSGVLKFYFDKHAKPEHEAIDFGCGVGKAFPYLSPRFRRVVGTDISAECLALAKQRGFTNISYKRADLTSRGLKFKPADFGFCCNVIMLPEMNSNREMIRNIHRALHRHGIAVIVMPSLESILLATARLIEWYEKEGVEADEIPATEWNYYKGPKRNVVQGIIHIDGVPTQHYTEPLLKSLFASANFQVTALEKIEYEWTTEFDTPPRWMKDPYPWDWLVEVRKT